MTPSGPVTPDSGGEPVLDDVQRAALKAFIGANGRSAGLLAAVAAVRPLIEAEAASRIADAIEAANWNDWDVMGKRAYRDAARIARGETP